MLRVFKRKQVESVEGMRSVSLHAMQYSYITDLTNVLLFLSRQESAPVIHLNVLFTKIMQYYKYPMTKFPFANQTDR